MRSGKELILASKMYSCECRAKSWTETIITLVLLIVFFSVTLLPIPLFFRLIGSVGCALLYVRMFVIYHDYQHNAILQNSTIATLLMQGFGIYILAPQNIWKRSHDHHHNHNSKLTITGIGSYPTICKKRYLQLSKKQQQMYLINRHPLTVLLGYFTLFIYWLNVKSFVESPKKHLDSLFALFFHFAIGTAIFYYFGGLTFFVSWFLPFLIAFGMGSYLFYCQHNFPDAQFRENQDWAYDNAALTSSSFMVMNPILQWLTGNIGYHHVHHLNSRI
ncbi:MAG TPA: fatty acid desaturase, partial [Cyclobacteriaceae bacterium]